MRKKFNITGWCDANQHYMADTSEKFRQIMNMVEEGAYFTINRPHQFGKTTMLRQIANELNTSSQWLVFRISFEGLGTAIFEDPALFCKTFLRRLSQQITQIGHTELAQWLDEKSSHSHSLDDLSAVITSLAQTVSQKLVLLIDEVDSTSNQSLFLEFLGMLRHKYLNRDLQIERTFHSVILTGVHDIKTLKLKFSPNTPSLPYNSPWNIATDFEVDMNFQAQEIMPMLAEYSQASGVELDLQESAKRLVYYTSGYPFLVSAICKILDEKILPQKQEAVWTTKDIDLAVNALIKNKRSNTNFDHLIKTLENNPELYQLVFNILIEKQHYDFNIQDPIIHLGVLYGIFEQADGNGLKIHNRIYSELIFNYMTSKVKRQVNMGGYDLKEDYLLPDNQLNMKLVLDKFQRFMVEQASEKEHTFLEKNGTLLFLGFLQPIINGSGFAFKEAQISSEKRIDVIATFYEHQYIIEMKIWRGESAHEKGLAQLADYLTRQHLSEGWLLIFDFRKNRPARGSRWYEIDGKQIYAVWV